MARRKGSKSRKHKTRKKAHKRKGRRGAAGRSALKVWQKEHPEKSSMMIPFWSKTMKECGKKCKGKKGKAFKNCRKKCFASAKKEWKRQTRGL